MIPLGGFGLFLRGFNVGIVGYQIRVVLGVTELFWEWFGFSGGTLGFGGLGFSSGFGRRGLRDFFSGSGIRLSLGAAASVAGGLGTSSSGWTRTPLLVRVQLRLMAH